MMARLRPALKCIVFDFAGDLYGQQLKVELVSFIRPERKFDSIQALIAQIGADAETAKGLLDIIPNHSLDMPFTFVFEGAILINVAGMDKS
jgi:hypothetical protein